MNRNRNALPIIHKNIIFFESLNLMRDNLLGLGSDLNFFSFFNLKIFLKSVILLTWIRIRINQILWIRIRIQSIRLHITYSLLRKYLPLNL